MMWEIDAMRRGDQNRRKKENEIMSESVGTSECRVCRGPATIDEISSFPYVCRRCFSQHAAKIDAAQRRAIAFMQRVEQHAAEPHRQSDSAAREKWTQSIRDGLRRMGL
jgi:hypothetical protein